jgi:hypothetical protein
MHAGFFLKARLRPQHSQDGALVRAALYVGFFFPPSSREFLDVGRVVPGRGLLGHHIIIFSKREPVHLEKSDAANEVQLTIEGSKTGIYNRGRYRNHFAHQDCTFGERLCFVEALLFLLFKQAPQSFFC